MGKRPDQAGPQTCSLLTLKFGGASMMCLVGGYLLPSSTKREWGREGGEAEHPKMFQ